MGLNRPGLTESPEVTQHRANGNLEKSPLITANCNPAEASRVLLLLLLLLQRHNNEVASLPKSWMETKERRKEDGKPHIRHQRRIGPVQWVGNICVFTSRVSFSTNPTRFNRANICFHSRRLIDSFLFFLFFLSLPFLFRSSWAQLLPQIDDWIANFVPFPINHHPSTDLYFNPQFSTCFPCVDTRIDVLIYLIFCVCVCIEATFTISFSVGEEMSTWLSFPSFSAGKKSNNKKKIPKRRRRRERKKKKYSNFGVFPSETHLVFIGSGEIRRNWLPLDDKLQLNQSVLSHNCASIEALHKYNTGVGFFLSPHAQSLRQFVFLRPVSDAH